MIRSRGWLCRLGTGLAGAEPRRPHGQADTRIPGQPGIDTDVFRADCCTLAVRGDGAADAVPPWLSRAGGGGGWTGPAHLGQGRGTLAIKLYKLLTVDVM